MWPGPPSRNGPPWVTSEMSAPWPQTLHPRWYQGRGKKHQSAIKLETSVESLLVPDPESETKMEQT